MWKYKLIIMVLRNARKVKIIIKVHFPSHFTENGCFEIVERAELGTRENFHDKSTIL